MNKRIILLGAPGCGKGTISNILIDKLSFYHLSTGNLFREELQNNGILKDKINLYLNNGELVPDEITNSLVKNKIENIKDIEKIIFDGFPRSIEQAKFLEKYINIDFVLYIDVPDDLIIKRISGRINCPKCNSIYNEYFLKPKIENICDKDGTKLIKRKDDNIETISNRLKTYYKFTFPLVKFYEEKNILIKINGGDEIEFIIDKIKSKINI